MSKSRCCNEYAIKYSSIGIKGDVNTHYTCTYCGKISDKPKEEKEDEWIDLGNTFKYCHVNINDYIRGNSSRYFNW